MSKAGTGTGHVEGSSQLQIDCGSDCESILLKNKRGALVATPDEGSIFKDWSGACSGIDDDTCSIQMDANKSVTATFELSEPEPTPTPTPTPTVSPTPEPEVFDVSVSLRLVKRNGKLLARGKVSSAEPSCMQGVTVKIFRVRGEQTIRKGSAVTGSDGRYRHPLRTKRGTYMAMVDARAPSALIQCSGAESAPERKG